MVIYIIIKIVRNWYWHFIYWQEYNKKNTNDLNAKNIAVTIKATLKWTKGNKHIRSSNHISLPFITRLEDITITINICEFEKVIREVFIETGVGEEG